MKRAVFYIASSDDNGRFIQEAVHSASSVKEQLGLPCFLFLSGGEGEEDVQIFDRIYELPDQKGPYWYLDSTRFFVAAVESMPEIEQLLYLDTDTYIAWPCMNIFDLLDQYEYAVGHSPQRDCCASSLNPPPPESFCTLEIGVNVFRNTGKVRKFLRQEWLGRYEAAPHVYDNNDNGALRDALWLNTLGLKWVTLAPEWCLRFDFGAWVQGRVRILHGRNGGISTNVVPLTPIANEINSTYRMRMWRWGHLLEGDG